MTFNKNRHTQVMEAVLAAIQDKPLILKGGTALMMCYGLNRFSEDLDFDIKEGQSKPSGTSLHNILSNVKGPDFKVVSVTAKKDTDAVGRFMINYTDNNGNEPYHLKFEASYRTPRSDELVSSINGINVLAISAIAQFKVGAVLDNSFDMRTTSRDLFDAKYIAKAYPQTINTQDLIGLMRLDLDSASARYSPAFKDDLLLNHVDPDDVILSLQASAENELVKRKNEVSLKSEADMLTIADKFCNDSFNRFIKTSSEQLIIANQILYRQSSLTSENPELLSYAEQYKAAFYVNDSNGNRHTGVSFSKIVNSSNEIMRDFHQTLNTNEGKQFIAELSELNRQFEYLQATKLHHFTVAIEDEKIDADLSQLLSKSFKSMLASDEAQEKILADLDITGQPVNLISNLSSEKEIFSKLDFYSNTQSPISSSLHSAKTDINNSPKDDSNDPSNGFEM